MTDWIEWTWTEEKPYPEMPDTLVHVRFADGEEESEEDAWCVKYWGIEGEGSNWYNLDEAPNSIVAYRVVK